MNCKNCGNPLSVGNKFCNACGTPCDVQQAPVAPVTPVVEAPVAPVAPAAPVEETPVVAPAETPVAPVAPEVVAEPVTPEVAPVAEPVVETPVAPVVETPAPVAPAVETPVAPVAPAPVAPVAAAPVASTSEAPAKKKSNAAFIIIVLLLVAVMVFLGKMIFENLDKDDKKDPNPKTTEKVTTTTTTTTTTTSTTAAIVAQGNYQTLYGYKFLVPSGYESEVKDPYIFMWNKTLKKQVGATLLSGTFMEYSESIEDIKTQFEGFGYTNITTSTSTYAGIQYLAFHYTYSGYTFTDYFIQLEDGVMSQITAFYTNILGEETMKELVFAVHNNIESPIAGFAGVQLSDTVKKVDTSVNHTVAE